MRLFLLPSLILLACLSPALTYAALWQTKEWRTDRLYEHLSSEGWFRQLFGIVRPLIVIGSVFLAPVLELRIPWYTAGLTVLAAASLAQILTRRQRMPVRTKKAMILLGGTLLLTLAFGIWFLEFGSWPIILLPLLQPFFLGIAWLLFLPVDLVMKRRILSRAAALRNRYDNCTVIGITGSAGKTTAKELIAHIQSGTKTLATPAYVNSEMGVAAWLQEELPKHATGEALLLIVEMGAYRTGEITKLCEITKPTFGVLTLIGSQHVALFGSREKLLRAKAELLASLPADGTAFVNADCASCLTAATYARCPVMKVSTGGTADMEAHDIEETSEGIRFSIGNIPFDIPLHGTHNVVNVLLAVAISEKLGVGIRESAQRLRTFRPPHGTFSVRTEQGITILDDTHNSSAASFRAAIAWARSQPATQKILVTPGIIELGEETDRIHAELGAAAAGIIDRVIFTTKRGKPAFEQGYGKPTEHFTHETKRVEPDSLLLCVGRIGNTVISRLLPEKQPQPSA